MDNNFKDQFLSFHNFIKANINSLEELIKESKKLEDLLLYYKNNNENNRNNENIEKLDKIIQDIYTAILKQIEITGDLSKEYNKLVNKI